MYTGTRDTSKPPYALRIVGTGAERPVGPTSKYGTRVPSSLVAKCCSTASPSASKNAGIDFSDLRCASAERSRSTAWAA